MNDSIRQLRAEIEHVLRTGDRGAVHAAVFRGIEQGLGAEQIAKTLDADQGYVREVMKSLAHLLGGTMPTSRTAASLNLQGYRELLSGQLSPELYGYVDGRVRRLTEASSATGTDPRAGRRAEPITGAPARAPRTVAAPPRPEPKARKPAPARKPVQERPLTVCPNCQIAHAGECY